MYIWSLIFDIFIGSLAGVWVYWAMEIFILISISGRLDGLGSWKDGVAVWWLIILM